VGRPRQILAPLANEVSWAEEIGEGDGPSETGQGVVSIHECACHTLNRTNVVRKRTGKATESLEGKNTKGEGVFYCRGGTDKPKGSGSYVMEHPH